jgi:PIN domain nuclease of toxin-antitoxin system
VILLIDTHVFLWFLRDDSLLSATAKTLLQDPTNKKFISIASCWELAIKAGLGKLGLTEPTGVLLSREIPMNKFVLLDIKLEHATAVETLPLHHKDPFDRLLVAQALIEAIPIVSADVALDPYGVQRLW